MTSTTEKTFDFIRNLVQACRDSEQGYRDAAQKIKDPDLRTYFNERSRERAEYALEIRNAAKGLGNFDVPTSGSAGGNIRRLWMDLKANLGGGDHTILSSLEAAEDSVKNAYQE